MFFARRYCSKRRARKSFRQFHSQKPTCRLRLELLEDRRVPSTFTVTTTADDLDGGALSNPAGPDGTLSLREAITVTNLSPGTDTLALNIPGAGVPPILLGSALPALVDPAV